MLFFCFVRLCQNDDLFNKPHYLHKEQQEVQIPNPHSYLLVNKKLAAHETASKCPEFHQTDQLVLESHFSGTVRKKRGKELN